jgi:cyclophilin family peptidyl-prolyl cis-trans isomerase
MHTPFNHLSPAVVLSVILGWLPASAGWTAASAGPEEEGCPSLSTQTPGSTPVQAPPLQAPAPAPAPAPGNPVVVISTTLGDVTLELFKDLAPVSVDNFLRYVNDGFYEGTVFHRVKPGFMIQGGGFTPALIEKPTRTPIQNEATNGLRNTRGTLAMARRVQLRSATSQFYINVADNRMLDHTGYSPDEFGYAVFVRVIAGMEVADRISQVPTKTASEMDDVPVDPVIIKSVRVVK